MLSRALVGTELEGKALGERVAYLASDNSLTLVCAGLDGIDGIDGGALKEVSSVSGLTCTRAGKSMVIDFIFIGTVLGSDRIEVRTS